MNDYDKAKFELCKKIIDMAKQVIKDNAGHDIRFYKKVYNKKEFDKV